MASSREFLEFILRGFSKVLREAISDQIPPPHIELDLSIDDGTADLLTSVILPTHLRTVGGGDVFLTKGTLFSTIEERAVVDYEEESSGDDIDDYGMGFSKTKGSGKKEKEKKTEEIKKDE